MSKGHVAVVSQVLTDRIIQVTHANWSLIDGARGQVERDVTVVDVSPAGDWSQVKVWYDPAGDLGKTVYPTYGFIYQSTQFATRSAAETAVRTVAQTAMSQLAAAVPEPGLQSQPDAQPGDRLDRPHRRPDPGGHGLRAQRPLTRAASVGVRHKERAAEGPPFSSLHHRG